MQREYVAEHIETAREFLRAWAAQDIDRCMALLHTDATFADNVGDSLVPYAGETRGREAIQKIMEREMRNWEHLAIRPGPMLVSTARHDQLHCQIEFLIRHRPTGERLFGKNRFVARLEDGVIKSINIFHDAPMFEAFLKLIGSPR